MNHVSVDEKKEFLRWFLSHHQCKSGDASSLLRYILVHDEILKNVKFTSNVECCDKSIIVSTTCSSLTSFQFVKKGQITYSVSKAFHDLRLNPDETVYIAIYFKKWKLNYRYAVVLEDGPVEEHYTTQDHLNSLLAEIALDQVIRRQRVKQLYDEIDQALENRDHSRFLELTGELNRLKRQEVQ